MSEMARAVYTHGAGYPQNELAHQDPPPKRSSSRGAGPPATGGAAIKRMLAQAPKAAGHATTVSHTHLTLPTIYSL